MKEMIQGFVWEKKYETGIEKIDFQHREIFVRINNLQIAIYNNIVKDEIHKLERFLADYIDEHFELEENL